MNRLEREIAAQRAALLRVERNGASKIASAYVAVERRLKANVALLLREIERAHGEGIEVKPGWLFAQQRYAVLIEELQQSLLGFLHRSVAAAVKAQGEAVARAPRDAEALIFAAIGPAPEAALRSLRSTFGSFPAAQFEHLIGRASNGQPLGDLLGEIVPASTEAVRNSLAYGVAAGLNPRVVAQDIQIRSGMARTRALAIARTEMLGAYRTVTSERFRTSNVVLSWTWVAMLDQRTCPACLSMNGTVHSMDEGLDSHPNCFPAGTVVSGPPATAAISRWYNGEVVILRLAGGDELTVTPNHPILTPNGWIAAGSLDIGRDIIRSSGQQRPLSAVNPDNHKSPTLIEDVAEALRDAGGVRSASVPPSAEYLHGDGLGGEINVVWADGLLGNGANAALAEPFREHFLGFGDVGHRLLAGFRPLAQLIEGSLATASRLMGGLGIAPIFLGCPLGHHQSIGLGWTSDHDARIDKAQADGTALNAEFRREAVLRLTRFVPAHDLVIGDREGASLRLTHLAPDERLSLLRRPPGAPLTQDAAETFLTDSVPTRGDLGRFAGDVFTDRIIDLERRAFRGHVYNLETVDGWYTANNTIVHNCRCVQAPRTSSWKELGFTGIPDTRPQFPSAEQAFSKLPEAKQLAILGQARLDAYNAGLISMEDLVRETRSPRWGTGRRAATLTELGLKV